MKNFLLFISLFLLLNACSSDKIENFPFLIVEKENLTFPIDSLSTHRVKNLQIYKTAENEFLCFYNKTRHAIDVYSLADKKLYKIIKLKKEGVNAIPFRPNGLYIHNFDSIFFNTFTTVFLIDSSATIKKRFTIQENLEYSIRNPTYAPILFINNKLLFTYTLNGKLEKEHIFWGMDLNTGKISYKQPYPDYYMRFGGDLSVPYFCFGKSYCLNKENNTIAMLFPLSDTLYISNGQDFVKKIPLNTGPQKITTKFLVPSPLTAPENFAKATFNFGIQYDEKNHVYYLFTQLAQTDEEFQKEPFRSWSKAYYLRVLNNEFEVVAKMDITRNKIFGHSSLFCSSGLIALNDNQSSEDSLSFSVFTVKKNTNN